MLLVAVWAGAGTVQTAGAQNKEDGCLTDALCKEQYDQAIKLYDQGKYSDALPKFEAAYTRRQMPWLILNIGRTMQRLGRPQEAIVYYERYKKAALNLDPATLDRVNKYIDQARALLEKAPENKPLRLDPAQTTAQNPSPLTATDSPHPVDEPAKKPIYKKWSYKKNFGSDGGRCWNGGEPCKSQSEDEPIMEDQESYALESFSSHRVTLTDLYFRKNGNVGSPRRDCSYLVVLSFEYCTVGI